MKLPASFFQLRLRVLHCFVFLLAMSLAGGLAAAELPKKNFDVPAGDAADTLRLAGVFLRHWRPILAGPMTA